LFGKSAQGIRKSETQTVFSQLSRSCEQRTDKRPILSDLRDSGSIEQDADSVLMLYRESYFNELCDEPEVTDMYLRKNRHGHVELRFDSRKMTFTENRGV
jgi:replicative DNA helicase